MFGFRADGSTPFVYNMNESPRNQGLVLENKYVKIGGQRVLTEGLGIDCSNLVQQSLLGSGYAVDWFQASPDHPPSFMQNGELSPRASRYYDVVDPGDVRPGDLILFVATGASDHGGNGHVGIVETAPDPTTGVGTFYGSQSSTGPGGDQRFNIITGTWSKDSIVAGLRVKDSAYDPEAAARRLEPILARRNEQLIRLADEDPNQADAAHGIIGSNELLLESLTGASGRNVSQAGNPFLDRSQAAKPILYIPQMEVAEQLLGTQWPVVQGWNTPSFSGPNVLSPDVAAGLADPNGRSYQPIRYLDGTDLLNQPIQPASSDGSLSTPLRNDIGGTIDLNFIQNFGLLSVNWGASGATYKMSQVPVTEWNSSQVPVEDRTYNIYYDLMSSPPVVLDLNGDGIDIAQLNQSNTFMNVVGDGLKHRTAWAGAGDGVLMYDAAGNSAIDDPKAFEFTRWDPTAATDMQALADVFDTNHNGKLDAGDAGWDKFKVLVTNADGTTTLETLGQLGITAINLTSDTKTQTLADGSVISGQTTFTRADGSTGTAADVSFAYDANGHAAQTVTTHNADGSTTIDTTLLNADGSRAGESISTISADGRGHTLRRDTTGSGIFDSVQSDVTVVNADGSRTETLSDFNAAGVLRDRTVTTTSADGHSQTIARDLDGNGTTDLAQVAAIVVAADGSSVTTQSDSNGDGSLRDRTVTSLGADGLSRTVQSDLDGNGAVDLTTTDVTVLNAGGSRTETVTELNADGSRRDQTVTVYGADGRSRTVSADRNGDGIVDHIETIVIAADGSSIDTIDDVTANGTLRSRTIVSTSADGLSKTTQIDAAGAVDANGHAVDDLVRSDITVANADGSRTETVTETHADSSLKDRTVTTVSADGLSRTTRQDSFGVGIFNFRESYVYVSNSDGSKVETVTDTHADGSLMSRSVITTSADRLSVLAVIDATGSGTASQTQSTLIKADGSTVKTVTDLNANGSVRDRSVTTTSANGLSVTTQTDSNGDGQFDQTRTDVTVLNADGSRTETVTDLNADGSLRDRTVKTVTASGLSATTQSDLTGHGRFDRTHTDVTVLN
ncbi:MAG: hypothetical protein E6501_13625, partial [Bradyrhizobium sp.]|nr:hypothetical protein [Bradyrhizobium sp.]